MAMIFGDNFENLCTRRLSYADCIGLMDLWRDTVKYVDAT
jgi:hypothetical protein